MELKICWHQNTIGMISQIYICISVLRANIRGLTLIENPVKTYLLLDYLVHDWNEVTLFAYQSWAVWFRVNAKRPDLDNLKRAYPRWQRNVQGSDNKLYTGFINLWTRDLVLQNSTTLRELDKTRLD